MFIMDSNAAIGVTMEGLEDAEATEKTSGGMATTPVPGNEPADDADPLDSIRTCSSLLDLLDALQITPKTVLPPRALSFAVNSMLTVPWLLRVLFAGGLQRG